MGRGTSPQVVVFQLPPSLEGEHRRYLRERTAPLPRSDPSASIVCRLLENTASRTYARDLNGFSAVNAHTRLSGRERAWGPAVACCGFQRCQRAHDVPLRAMDTAVQRAVECHHSRSACEGRGGREERSRKFQPTSDKASPQRAGQGRGGRSSPGAGRAAAQAPRFASIRSRHMRFSRQYAHGSYSHAIGKRVREQIHMGSSDNIPFVVLHESPLFIVVVCGRCINAYLRPVIAR